MTTAKKTIRLSMAQYRLLRQLVQPQSNDILSGLERRSLPVLIEHDLVTEDNDRLIITRRGDRYLSTHRPVGKTVIDCDRRSRITRKTIKEDYGFTDRMIDELLPARCLI